MKHLILRSAIIALCVAIIHVNARAGGWAEEQLDSMSLEEKIGQCIFAKAVANEKELHTTFGQSAAPPSGHEETITIIREHHIGGLFFVGRDSTKADLIAAVQKFQKSSNAPLMIALDAEWGAGMRLRDVPDLPRAMTLGALPDEADFLIDHVGFFVGTQCRRLGVHMALALVGDINTRPENPVIGQRSFGQSEPRVTAKSLRFMGGIQNAGLLACAKHFPGHGDTATDSHHELPYLTHSRERIDAVELQPYRALIAAGRYTQECAKLKKLLWQLEHPSKKYVPPYCRPRSLARLRIPEARGLQSIDAIMTAHLEVPSLEAEPGRPTSMSHAVVTDMLRNRLRFEGLVVSDSLTMEGAARFQQGLGALEAFTAGTDILLNPDDIPTAIHLIREAIDRGEVSTADLDQRVLRILHAKERTVCRPDFERTHASDDPLPVAKKVFEMAVTLVKNSNNTLPLSQRPSVTTIGSRSSGQAMESVVHQLFERSRRRSAITSDAHPQPFLISIHGNRRSGLIEERSKQADGIPTEPIEEVITNARRTGTPVVVALFASPYALPRVAEADAILVGYEDAPEAHKAVVQKLFGRQPAGILPVTAGPFKIGTSLRYEEAQRSDSAGSFDLLSFKSPDFFYE